MTPSRAGIEFLGLPAPFCPTSSRVRMEESGPVGETWLLVACWGCGCRVYAGFMEGSGSSGRMCSDIQPHWMFLRKGCWEAQWSSYRLAVVTSLPVCGCRVAWIRPISLVHPGLCICLAQPSVSLAGCPQQCLYPLETWPCSLMPCHHSAYTAPPR